MPAVTRNKPFTNRRGLISGLQNQGKSYSLPSFIYGPYDHIDPDQSADAIAYAEGKHMVILSCPSETGYITLPDNNDNITSIYFEYDERYKIHTLEFSKACLAEFYQAEREMYANKPDVVAYDGIHHIAYHTLNVVSYGEYFSGEDMSLDANGKIQPYRSAKFYNQLSAIFYQTIAAIYNRSTPLIVCTVWEEWKGGEKESIAGVEIKDQRYLWPAIPGGMSQRMSGMFDFRVSARTERVCFHSDCEYSKAARLHHVWQIADRGEVMGLGVKGLRMGRALSACPYIHSNWFYLEELIKVYGK